MQAEQLPLEPSDLGTLNVIRVETALSRYPVHRLAKKGSIVIEIREEDERGQTTLRWEVSHNSRYGQPGPLAYKVDTLIVNRRIEGAPRPVPRVIRLGSLRDICRELGVNEGQATRNVKKALYQNAFAGIRAKIRYKLADGAERSIEIGDTRYAVVFTGEKLPDGRTADAVYLILHDFFREVVNNATTRPLDYDYLRGLTPASQRFYELVSYQIFGALKHGRARARLAYSEYCTYAPQTRYFDWEHVRKQMAKVHAPHRKSGYLEDIAFEARTDRDGQPDWLMLYIPGAKARAEYRTFTKKGGTALPAAEDPKEMPELAPSPAPGQTGPEQELIARGVTALTASGLVREYPADRIEAKIEVLDWLLEKKDKRASASPAGFLVESIRKDYAPPKGFESRAERKAREQAEQERQRQEAEARRRQKQEQAREKAIQVRIAKHWDGLTPEEQDRLDAEALEQAEESLARSYREMAESRNPMAAGFLRLIREAHIKKLLGIS
ncbi:hypothetical protein [Tautonia sociabilis]|uniref:RepB family plasmid replication initiator protein n=1 Tax=Tautonia sociabilis TaxID=2080755 RepID=A0A432ML37_9BACT|nr:hypothetical protein [Tautonia sociabilis]RUL87990.1 hypothetical protein TsocGM_09720 [Tautonia sociabilis]